METVMEHQSPLNYESYIKSVPLETLLELYPIWVSFYYETEVEDDDDLHVKNAMLRVYEHNATVTLHEIKIRVGKLVEFAADMAAPAYGDDDDPEVIMSKYRIMQVRAEPLAEEYYGNC